MFKSNPRIAIVGTGAIGAYYGARLSRAGADVCFLFRSDYAAAKERGIRVEFAGRPEKDFTQHPVKAYDSAEAIGEVDIVLVALKSTANAVLPELLAPLVGKDTWLVTLQNGMGNAECLAEHFGVQRVLGAICFISLNRIGPAHIFNQYDGYLSVAEFEGLPSERTAYLKGLFENAGIRCDELPSLEETLWRKLCWNIPFNGLAIAAGGVTTDVLLGHEGLSALVRALMEEVRSAAAAHGYVIDDAFLDKQIHVTTKMGAYKPSSLIDYLEGRPVELGSIWLEPLRRGQAKGLPMPRLEMLTQLIEHRLEARAE